MRRVRDERGSGLIELVWLGLLLLIPLVWIILSVFEVQRGAFATSGAARAAGRAYSLAATDAEGRHQAQAVARQTLDDQGAEGMPLEVSVSCTPVPANCHAPGSIITVRINSRVDLPWLPSMFDGQQATFALEAAHHVPIGLYQEAAP